MNYFFIENTYSGTNTVTLTTLKTGSPTSGTYATSVEYSKDGSSWSTFNLTDSGNNTVTLDENEKVYFRNNSGYWNNYTSQYVQHLKIFTANQSHKIGGDLRSLIDYTDDYVNLKSECFVRLFNNDTNLTDASDLEMGQSYNITSVKNYTCFRMFDGCTGLITPPSLPFSTLGETCYMNMFKGCTSLTTAPTLPATTLAEDCYRNMFSGCTSLSEVTTYANDISATECTYYWLENVAATGKVYNMGSATYTTGSVSGIPSGWSESTYFYIENISGEQNDVELTTTGSGASQASSVEYSKDKNSWATFFLDDGNINTITLNQGEKVYFRNDSGMWNSGYSNTTNFTANQSHIVGGNVNTLIDYTNLNNITLTNYCFYGLFWGDSQLTSAANLSLPSTTLAEGCYSNMFSDCDSLTTPPALSATTLASNCYESMFNVCYSLTTPPSLPATTLASNCYQGMFQNCGLTTPPSLPATTLASNCYESMFNGCAALTSAPILPATTLADYCYSNMFSCTGLTTAPTLSATTLAQNCYDNMFNGCYSLTTPPSLPATTLASNCYQGMFQNCGLTTPPALPATTLVQACYNYMFYGCYSLTTPPSLPATTLAESCYSYMFAECGSLNEVTTYANDISASDCIECWLDNVAVTGTFYNNGSATYTVDSPSGIPQGWTEVRPTPSTYTITATAGSNGSISPSGAVTVNVGADQTFTVTPDTGYIVDTLTVDGATATLTNDTYTFSNVQADHTISVTFKLPDLTDYFYIENTYNGQNTVTLTTTQNGTPTAGTYATSVQYSKDKNSWTTLTLTAGGTNTITLESGEKVYFRNDSGKWSSVGMFNINNIFYTSFISNQNHIVGGNVNTLIKYSDLTNISLVYGSFYKLFNGNRNLTSASNLSLPSTTLANYCYMNMFNGCSSLTTAPSLPATTLAESCYSNMFYNCTSLTTAPSLPATRVAQSCYGSMFRGCTSLTTAPSLPATTLTQKCYMNMFNGCSSLTTAPSLPATTLANDCYSEMFNGCTSLTTPPTLPATTLTQSCYAVMFRNCTSLTSAPTLPATTLAQSCYNQMFYGCTSLNSVTTYANDISANSCIASWLQNVAATGTFNNNGSATYPTNSSSGIPTGWTEVRPSKTITATAGSNGSISPSGAVSVNVGSDQTFTFTPDTGYEVDTVTVDGSTVTPTNNTYTFTNVQADHTISVTFKVQTFTINSISEGHTTVNPSGLVTVNYGASQTFTFSPEVGYELDKLYIDGVETAFSGSSYTFTNVQADHTLEITSKLMTFSIEATSSEGGSITPDGIITVDYDGNATFEITPSTGYLLWELLVDGFDKKDELVDNTYTFENVTANHTIHAVFDDIYLTVTATSGPNGSITPTGDVEVIYNGNQIFNITPNEGYEIDKVMLDGVDVTDDVEDFNYTMRNIVENHILEVSFKETYIPEPKGFNLTGMKNTDYAKQYKK